MLSIMANETIIKRKTLTAKVIKNINKVVSKIIVKIVAQASICPSDTLSSQWVSILNISEISKTISSDFNLSKRDVYQLLIKNKY